MDRSEWIKNIAQSLTSEKGKNYSYLTLFFVIFSVFVFFAIRPSLRTAFSLRQEAATLRVLNTDYEVTITKIITIQQGLEQLRDDLFLLSEAVPERPNVNKLIEDIEATGARHSVTLTQVTIDEVNLLQKGSSSVKNLTLKMKASSDFPSLMGFLTELSDQRRIKLSDIISIKKEAGTEASASGQLEITMDIEGFHL